MQQSGMDLAQSQCLMIGFTARTGNDQLDYRTFPMKVASMVDFERFFGGKPEGQNLAVELTSDGKVKEVSMRFCLYASAQLFFANGGGSLNILTAGSFAEGESRGAEALDQAMAVLGNGIDHSLLAIPDAHWGDRDQLLIQALEVCEMRRVTLLCWDGRMGDSFGHVPPHLGTHLAVFGPQARYSLPFLKDWAQWRFRADESNEEVRAIRESLSTWQALGNDPEAVANGTWVDAMSAISDLQVVHEIGQWLEVMGPLIPLSGAICGILIKRDREVGPWLSGSGQVLEGIKPASGCVDGMNGVIAYGQASILRSFYGYAGAEGNSPSWLQLRRLGMAVMDNCSYYLSQFQGNPNRIEVWQAAANACAGVLSLFYQRGAFAKGASEECWFLQIGIGTTLSESEAASGLMRVRIGYAPIFPNQFEIVEIEIMMQPWAEGQ